MEALVNINTGTVNTDTSSNIQTTGILPRYYDSAPNIIISDTKTLIIPSDTSDMASEPDAEPSDEQ